MKHIGFRAHDLGHFRTAAGLADAAASFKHPVTIQLALQKVLQDARDPIGYDSEYVTSIHDALLRKQVSIAVLGCYFNPIHPDEEVRKLQIARFISTLRHAQEFGCPFVATETGSLNPDCSYHPLTAEEENLTVFFHTLEQLLEAAEKYDATVCIEPVSRSHTICSIQRMATVLEKYPTSHLGVIYDPVNLVPYTGIPEKDGSNRLRPSREAQELFFTTALDAFAGRIKAIHVKDYRLNGQGLKIGDMTAGTGVMDWNLFSTLLEQRDMQVPCLLENLNPATLPDTLKFLQQ